MEVVIIPARLKIAGQHDKTGQRYKSEKQEERELCIKNEVFRRTRMLHDAHLQLRDTGTLQVAGYGKSAPQPAPLRVASTCVCVRANDDIPICFHILIEMFHG
mgnify:CR=1 FL=1